MSQPQDIIVNCDPETGLCTITDFATEVEAIDWKEGEEIIYVGDPMCSWCWGISPELHALQAYGESHAIPFTLVMGGLRPGGGEEWNQTFKDFLKHHWEEVNERSGQPFGMALFDKENFDYDTEPACRAVVTVRALAPDKTHAFYELVQHYFYVQSQDPKVLDFYRPICEKLSIDFAEFSRKFMSPEIKNATLRDFAQSRQWGIQGFPSVVYRKDDQLYLIARGYATYTDMKKRIQEINK